MKKTFLEKIKKQLEHEKISIEKELKSFAQKDQKPDGDWDTRFPHFDGESGGAALEKAADEIEEYETLLPIEFNLETKLKNINLALEKIRTSLSARTLNASHLKKGKFGICEKCGKKIPQERLRVCPEARFCLKCQK